MKRDVCMEDLFEILEKVSVVNRDNGKKFTCLDRLDAIAGILWHSQYRRIDSNGLFHLYSKKPSFEVLEPVILVSSHVDCEKGITRCFSRFEGEDMMLGTFDNSITNAAIISAMLSDELPDSVLVAFTGDEERKSRGADDLVDFLQLRKVCVQGLVVLDVTDMGWEEMADFTVENNFWPKPLGKQVVSFAERTKCNWRFVPSNPWKIPKYIDYSYLIGEEAEEDESWEYDEKGMPCFSFCLPVKGEMHSDDGVLVRKKSFECFAAVLKEMLKVLAY